MMMKMLKSSRLAVNVSLGSCRSFCKSSSSYNFSRQYIHLVNKKDTPLLVNYGNGYFHMLSSTILRRGCGVDAITSAPPVSVQFPNKFTACGPCHGIFCLYSVDGEVALWNPATGDIKNFPPEVPVDQQMQIHNVGFGFDSETCDFKIVRFVTRTCRSYFTNERLHGIEICSLKTNRWKEIPCPGYVISHMPFLSPPSFTDGASYWSCKRTEVSFISFDFAQEKFRRHTLPVPCRWGYSSIMDSFNGHPAALHSFRNGHGKIWLARADQDGKENWVCELELGPFDCSLEPQCVWNNARLILLDSDSHQLVWCDLITKELHESNLNLRDIKQRSSKKKLVTQILTFPQSLVPNPW